MSSMPLFIPVILLTAWNAVDEYTLHPNEIAAIDAALNESLTGVLTIDATYTFDQTLSPMVLKTAHWEPFPQSTHRWTKSATKESFSMATTTGRPHYRSEWVFDGRTTYTTQFDDHEIDTITGFLVEHYAPTKRLLEHNWLTRMIGLRTDYRAGGLLSYWQESRRTSQLSATKLGHKLDLDLGTFRDAGVLHKISLVVDPEHDYRIDSWRLTGEPVEYAGKTIADETTCQLEDFRLIGNGIGDQRREFPHRGRFTSPFATMVITVTEVRLNQPISDVHFAIRRLPPGTRYDDILEPGQPPQMKLVGNEAAVTDQIAGTNEPAQPEQGDATRTGTTFNATPPLSRATDYWLFGGLVLCGIAAALRWKLR